MNTFKSIKIYKESYSGCTYFNNEMFDEFAKANNIVSCCRAFETKNMYKTLNKQRITKADYGNDKPPYRDHCAAFKREDGAIIYTYQPYCAIDDTFGENYKARLDFATKCYEEVTAWAQVRNIKVTFCGAAHSWYYPGQTALIILTSKDIDIHI